MLPGEQCSLPMSLPSLAGTFCSPGVWGPCSAYTAVSSCSALELQSTGGWLTLPLSCWLQLACVANRYRHSTEPFGQSCASRCPWWVPLSTEIFAASPETVLWDPFRIWFLSTAGFHCRTPAFVHAPLTRKQESILRNCLVFPTASPAWICPVQVATPAGIPSGSGE